MAGFYPPYWEYVKGYLVAGFGHPRMQERVLYQVVDSYPVELGLLFHTRKIIMYLKSGAKHECASISFLSQPVSISARRWGNYGSKQEFTYTERGRFRDRTRIPGNMPSATLLGTRIKYQSPAAHFLNTQDPYRQNPAQ